MEQYESYIEEQFGPYTEVFHELVSPDIHLDIIIVPPTDKNPYYKLITMGMGAIMSAKRILLIANGKAKKDILEAAFHGEVTPKNPASILQNHPAALKDFFLFRLLHGLLGGGLTILLFALLPDTVSALAPDSAAIQPFTVSPTVSLVFLCMAVALLMSGKKRLPTGEKCDMV